MSGIAAIIRFDGADVEHGALKRMTSAMAYRGPDGIAHWHGGAAALGHCMMHTTRESLDEVQPLANEDGSLVLAMDGWLANYDELRRDLLARGARLRSASDAELALRAYEAWGEHCAARLEGEFALLVWNTRRREAYLARDHLGLRPLHYSFDGKRLIVASDPGGMLAAPGVDRRINCGLIAEIAANEWLTAGETVWEGILRPLPAHWMRFGKDRCDSDEYWSPPLEVSIRYRSEAEYREHYIALLDESVRRSLRSHRPVACDVSGGLDSSGIYCMAQRQLLAGERETPEVKGYTYRFDQGGRADEIAYARAVARHTGTEIREVPPFLPDLGWFAASARSDCDMAPYPNATMAESIGRALVADGCRVSLNGEGGDEWMGGKPFYFAEQLAERDMAAFLTSCREDVADLGLRATAWNIARCGIAPLLPRSIKKLVRRSLGPPGINGFTRAYWLSQSLNDLLASRREAVDGERFSSIANPARRSLAMTMRDPFCDLMRSHHSRRCARNGYEPRSPFHARQFVEFAFAIPERIRARGSNTRYLHSTALNGIVPQEVAGRKTKAEFSIAFDRHLGSMAGLLVSSASPAWLEQIDRGGMNRFQEEFQRRHVDRKPRWELWGCFAAMCLFDTEASLGNPNRETAS